ncbi:MAG: hypothetical protein HQL79_07000 [Magnetococcales bacterium]|nr:hypothetical protein [Magnetococcales bacterium]
MPDKSQPAPQTVLGVFLLIVLLGMSVRSWLVMEPENSDPISYFMAGAGRYLDPDFHLGMHHHHLRPLMAWIVGLPALLFGYSLTTFYTVVHAGALMTLVSWWVVAWILSGPVAAILVAVLWTTSFAALSADLTIVPDNWGASMSFFAIAAMVLAIRFHDQGQGETHHRIWYQARFWSLCGGFMLWAACAAKETFVIYCIAVLFIVMIHRNRWQMLGYGMLGLFIGGMMELVWFWVQFGDPLARIHYFKGINAVIDEVNTKFEPLDLTSFLLRLPRVVHYTRSAESLFFLPAIAGFFLWCRDWGSIISRIKIIVFVLPPAFVILAVKGIHPIQPYFDVVLRYYVPFLPFIYLATVDLFLHIWRWMTDAGHLALRRYFVAMGMIFYGVLISWNLLAAADYLPLLQKNGFNTNAAMQTVLTRDAEQTKTPKRLYLRAGMQYVTPLYFPKSAGWIPGEMILPPAVAPEFKEPGYMILSWPRINSDGNERPFVLSHLFLDYPIVFHSDVQGLMSDVLRVGPQKIHREAEVMASYQNKLWTLADDKGRSIGEGSPTHASIPVTIPKNGELTLTSLLSDGKPDPSLVLKGGYWLHVRLNAMTEGSFAILWMGLKERVGTVSRDWVSYQSLGTYYFKRVAKNKQDVSFFTFIPYSMKSYDLVIRAQKSSIRIDGMVASLLRPDPSDRLVPPDVSVVGSNSPKLTDLPREEGSQ